MRVLYISIFLLLASVVFSCSIASEGCSPVSEVRKDTALMRVLEPRAIRVYNDLYNAHPPQSNETYTAVWLVIERNTTRVLLGSEDEICAEVRVPSNMIERLINRVIGEPI